jgi:hypothetical protein
MSNSHATRERIRRIVARDLRPVRPLLTPNTRLLLLVPIAALVALLAAFRYRLGLLLGFDELGGFLTFGLSGLEWTVGVLILGTALRRAVPGDGVSRLAIWSLCGLAVVTMIAITEMTYAAHQVFVPPARLWRISYECILGPLEFGAPFLVVATVLAARAFPTHPGSAGALCGLASGVLVDSGWRLTCWITSPAHVLGTHFLAVAVLTGSGAIMSTVIDKVRSRTITAAAS